MRRTNMGWIEGYCPNWVHDKDTALELLESFAREWVGKSIDSTYVGWYTEDDTWYEDIPIVLIIGEKQYEICWHEFDDLSITENQLNLNSCMVSGLSIPMRKNSLPVLNKAIGKTILGVELGESEMSADDKKTRIINSVNFILEAGYLTVFNALDENGVADEPCRESIQKNYAIRI